MWLTINILFNFRLMILKNKDKYLDKILLALIGLIRVLGLMNSHQWLFSMMTKEKIKIIKMVKAMKLFLIQTIITSWKSNLTS